jgi:biotin synthase-related radical SAM superfamily protein
MRAIKQKGIAAGIAAVVVGAVGLGVTAAYLPAARAAVAPQVSVTALRQRPEEETRTKIVPILTVGSSLRAGVAQVSGPKSRVDDVKVVARLDTDYKDVVRIAVLVPVSTENVVSNIKRVPQVSVTAIGDLKLK